LALDVLTRSAQLERLWSNLEATDVSQEKTKAAASVAYYASRMEAVSLNAFSFLLT